MSEESDGKSDGNILSGLLRKVAESVVTPLVVATAISLGIAHSERLEDPSNWRLWILILTVFVIVAIAGDQIRRYYLRWRVPNASETKISLLLARLHGDRRDDSQREIVRESIKKELGDAVEILLWPEILRLAGGRDSDAEAQARAKAQRWLKWKHCDLIVWGRVKKSDDNLVLRFTASDSDVPPNDSYELTKESLELPVKFVSNLRSAIAARVIGSSGPIFDRPGQNLVPLMRQTAGRLEPIIKVLDSAYDSETRGSLRYSYALVRFTIGDQDNSRSDLELAVEAFRECLKEFTGEASMLQWAKTQNSLASALVRLGQIDQDSKRIREAIIAYDKALTVWTRDRVPYDWAMTKNNIAAALTSLGRGEKDQGILDDAVKACHNALEVRLTGKTRLDRAVTMNNLGEALQAIAELKNSTPHLEEAISAFQDALDEFEKEHATRYAQIARENLDGAEASLTRRHTKS